MALSENSAHEHERQREAIGEIKAEMKEMRTAFSALGAKVGDSVRDLGEKVLGWKGSIELTLAEMKARLEVVEKAHASREKTWAERVNVALNAVLVALVLWTLYKVTGIKTP